MSTIVTLPVIINSNVSAHHYYSGKPLKITIAKNIFCGLGPAYIRCKKFDNHYEVLDVVLW